MTRPLFVTGVARSGSTLLAQMLSAAAGVSVASDPYFPLFRSLRDGLLRDAGADDLPRGAPMEDYYFADERIRRLDAVQAGDLSARFDPAEREPLVASTAARAAVEAPELVSYLEGLRGATYEELFSRALELLREARPARNWVGCKEVWTIEFFAPLARAFPDARFVVILRDPRAVLASLQALAEADATQAAHPLSYCRHWRKEIAFLQRYDDLPLHVVRYEQLVADPEPVARGLCDFLEVPFAPEMLAPAWRGNSSFQERTEGIDASLAERWRTKLAPELLKLAELVCGPEMELAGYPLLGDGGPDESVLVHLVESDGWDVSWRSDLGDPQLDFALESGRRALLDGEPDVGEIRRAFLFPEARAALVPVEA